MDIDDQRKAKVRGRSEWQPRSSMFQEAEDARKALVRQRAEERRRQEEAEDELARKRLEEEAEQKARERMPVYRHPRARCAQSLCSARYGHSASPNPHCLDPGAQHRTHSPSRCVVHSRTHA